MLECLCPLSLYQLQFCISKVCFLFNTVINAGWSERREIPLETLLIGLSAPAHRNTACVKDVAWDTLTPNSNDQCFRHWYICTWDVNLNGRRLEFLKRAGFGVGKVCLVTQMGLIIPWCLMEDKVIHMQSWKESAQNNDFIWNMPHANEFGFEWWAMIFVWSYCVFQLSVNKVPLSCNFWNKFLCSVWSSPHCI